MLLLIKNELLIKQLFIINVFREKKSTRTYCQISFDLSIFLIPTIIVFFTFRILRMIQISGKKESKVLKKKRKKERKKKP